MNQGTPWQLAARTIEPSVLSYGYLAAYAADGTLKLKLANSRYGFCSGYLPH